jgi:hypothetical protein
VLPLLVIPAQAGIHLDFCSRQQQQHCSDFTALVLSFPRKREFTLLASSGHKIKMDPGLRWDDELG